MKGRAIDWQPEEIAWVKARADWPRRALFTAFCNFWTRDVQFGAFKCVCKRQGIMTGRSGCFPKGGTPANKGQQMPYNPNSAATRFKAGSRSGRAQALHKPVGFERRSKDGYLERKIHDGLPLQSRWRAVHLIDYEAANGPLPPGMCLKARDGDRTNLDPANWACIPRAMLPRLNGVNGRRYDSADAELQPTILAITQLEHAAREARKMKGKTT
jgi:hypothetical protein